MRNTIIAICVAVVLLSNCEAKRGGGGGSFSSRGGGSRPSSSGGWSFGGSKPSPSYSRPSPSYSAPSYRPAPAPAPSYKPPAASPSYGWNIPSSNSQPKPPAASPSYGWNLPSSNSQPKPPAAAPSYGWNVGNTGSNVKPAVPVGPPPSYPGMQNRPVPSNNAPPAYSPSHYNPPAYSPSYNQPSYNPSYNQPSYSPSYRQPSYSPSYNRPSYTPSNNNYRPSYQQPSHTSNHYSPSYSSRPSYSNQGGYYGGSGGYNNNYGNTFGAGGLPQNSYISNNYYGNQDRNRNRGSGFLTNALFFGGGLGGGYLLGSSRRSWNEEDDRKWRATTKAPYFENKVPGADVILPASAVVGAATAFGLVSLLPLNVPSSKPLMYCNQNASDIAQTQIFMNGKVYQCINETIMVSSLNCLKSISNENITNSLNETTSNITTTSTTTSTTTESSIENSTLSIVNNSTESAALIDESNSCDEGKKIMHCDGDESIYCVNGTLLSRLDIFCNSTTLMNGTANLNQSMIILNCYEGLLAEKQTGSIPTTTMAPTTTTQKSISFKSKVHAFLMRIIGQGDVIDKTTTTTTTEAPEIPQLSVDESIPIWVPEPLTIPPETTTTTEETTTAKMIWMIKSMSGNSTLLAPEASISLLDNLYKYDKNNPILEGYVRVASTTEATSLNSTTESSIAN